MYGMIRPQRRTTSLVSMSLHIVVMTCKDEGRRSAETEEDVYQMWDGGTTGTYEEEMLRTHEYGCRKSRYVSNKAAIMAS